MYIFPNYSFSVSRHLGGRGKDKIIVHLVGPVTVVLLYKFGEHVHCSCSNFCNKGQVRAVRRMFFSVDYSRSSVSGASRTEVVSCRVRSVFLRSCSLFHLFLSSYLVCNRV